MVPALKPNWSKPSTILFASEYPANEQAFAFALAQAMESDAGLIIFHAYDGSAPSAVESASHRQGKYDAARTVKHCFEPLAKRAGQLGIRCRIVVRPGSPASEILNFVRERQIDRLIMGAHTPGPIGKVLVGSVAEAVLRTVNVPVSIVGPHVAEGTYRNFTTRTILCSVDEQEASHVVAEFAADLAARHNACLVLQRVIPPQDCKEVFAGRSTHQVEEELRALIPARLNGKVCIRTSVVLGDPTEELLYQGRVLQANLIVMGAQGASHFAAITHAGILYKVLAYARCPVITLSPVLLSGFRAMTHIPHPAEVNYMAGVV
ncbi:MAG: universal stress protein [Terracidiphilus sp.]